MHKSLIYPIIISLRSLAAFAIKCFTGTAVRVKTKPTKITNLINKPFDLFDEYAIENDAGSFVGSIIYNPDTDNSYASDYLFSQSDCYFQLSPDQPLNTHAITRHHTNNIDPRLLVGKAQYMLPFIR